MATSITISLDEFKTKLELIEKHDILPESIEALDTLYVYLTNLISSPDEIKYHTISAVNIHFHERLGHFIFCESLLRSIGYIKYMEPIPHYKFDITLFQSTHKSTTIPILQQILQLVEALRTSLNQQFRHIPHIPGTEVPLQSVLGAGRYADRGRRPTMEDQEALIDNWYNNITKDIARLYTEFIVAHTTPSSTTSSSTTSTDQTTSSTSTTLSTEQVEKMLREYLPKYENLGFFAVYDGHGGTETAEFVVKFLHNTIQFEIKEYLNTILQLHIAPTIQIKQQQQYLHITDQFLKQLPHIQDVQHISTDDVHSTDYSGKNAFLFYEDFISKFISTTLQTNITSDITQLTTTPTSPPTTPLQLFNLTIDPTNPTSSSTSSTPSTFLYELKQTPETAAILQQPIPEVFSTLSTTSSTSTTPSTSQQSSSSSSSQQSISSLTLQEQHIQTLASKFLALSPSRLFTHALSQAHVRTDNQLRRCLALHSGCTTVTSIVGTFAGQRFIVSANVGDSRSVLGTQPSTCCHYASLPRNEKPHIFLRQSKSTTTQSSSTPQSSSNTEPIDYYTTQYLHEPTIDEYFTSLQLPLDKVRSYNNNSFQYGDSYLPKSSRCRAQRLTLDHKPSIPNETNRINSLGGFVTSNGRTMGVLAVSRALGDHGLKNSKHYVSSKPHIDLQCISNQLDNVAQNPYLILACDGVWDVLRDEDAILFISGIATTCIRTWLQTYNIQVCSIDKEQNNNLLHGNNNNINFTSTTKEFDDNNNIQTHTFIDSSDLHFDLEHSTTTPTTEKERLLHENRSYICHTCVQRFVPKVLLNNIMAFASQRLVELALFNGSTDNVTAMSIRL